MFCVTSKVGTVHIRYFEHSYNIQYKISSMKYTERRTFTHTNPVPGLCTLGGGDWFEKIST